MINSFYFDGERADQKYNLFICNVGSSSNERTLSKINYDNFQPVVSDTLNFTGSKHTEMLSKTIQVVQIIDCEITPFTNNNLEEIIYWLCRRDGYRKFKWYDDKGEIDSSVYYKAKIDASVEYINNQPYVLTLDITTDAPYGYQDVTKQITTSTTDFNLGNNFSADGIIYLDIQLVAPSSGTISIQSENVGIEKGDRITKLDNCSTGERIHFYSTQIVSSNNSDHNSKIYDDFNYIYPAINCDYEHLKNDKHIIFNPGVSNATIKYTLKRKVGL